MKNIFKKLKENENENVSNTNEVLETVELFKNDCALILRANGKVETALSFRDTEHLSTQQEIVISLGGLLQNPKFVQSIIEHMHLNLEKMIASNYSLEEDN